MVGGSQSTCREPANMHPPGQRTLNSLNKSICQFFNKNRLWFAKQQPWKCIFLCLLWFWWWLNLKFQNCRLQKNCGRYKHWSFISLIYLLSLIILHPLQRMWSYWLHWADTASRYSGGRMKQPGWKISPSQSEAMILSWKDDFPLRVWS